MARTISGEAEINSIRLKEQASAPDTPASGYWQLYVKDDGKLYGKDDAGNEVCFSDVFANPMTTAGDIIYGGVDGVATRLAKGDDDEVLTLKSGVPSWEAGGGGGNFIKITDTTLGVDTATVTFTSIAGTYTALKIIWMARADRAGQVFEGMDLQFNNDTGNNYDDHSVDTSNNESSGSISYSSNLGTSKAKCGSMPAATATAGAVACGEIIIPNYAGTTFHKAFNAICSVKYGTSAGNIHAVHFAGHWRSTSAITEIDFICRNGSNFLAGSRFTLYGLS